MPNALFFFVIFVMCAAELVGLAIKVMTIGWLPSLLAVLKHLFPLETSPTLGEPMAATDLPPCKSRGRNRIPDL